MKYLITAILPLSNQIELKRLIDGERFYWKGLSSKTFVGSVKVGDLILFPDNNTQTFIKCEKDSNENF